MENSDNKKNISKIQKDISENAVAITYQDNGCKALLDQDQRAVEQSRKGIFSCPYFSDFFKNQDEIRMK